MLISFRSFAKNWIDTYAKVELKPSTLNSYQSIINKHFIRLFGDFLLSEITIERLRKYKSDRLLSAQPKTVLNEQVLLKKMFKHAVEWGYLKNSPTDDVERPRVEKKEMEILNPEEIKRLLSCSDEPYATLFLTGIQTGMRRGEILGGKGGGKVQRKNGGLKV